MPEEQNESVPEQTPTEKNNAKQKIQEAYAQAATMISELEKAPFFRKMNEKLEKLYSTDTFTLLLLIKLLLCGAIFLIADPLATEMTADKPFAFPCQWIVYCDVAMSFLSYFNPSKNIVNINLLVAIIKSGVFLITCMLKMHSHGFKFVLISIIYICVLVGYDCAYFLMCKISERTIQSAKLSQVEVQV